MTPLRHKMITAMQMRGFSPRTHKSYLAAVTDLTRFTGRSPSELERSDIQAYFEHLVIERRLSAASCRVHLHGIRFLYEQVLEWDDVDVDIAVPQRPQRIPELLTRGEVRRIVDSCTNAKYRLMLQVCYGCGLRVSELVSLRVGDIDSERHLLRIEQGKGAKDRLVPLPETLMSALRSYWRLYRPDEFLFYGKERTRALTLSSIQKVFTRTKLRAGIDKIGGIHSLRHAYATHQLEVGLPVHRLQHVLGHKNITSTLRYVHWVPDYREATGAHDLLAALEVRHD
jgi:integrase/recombinase XerD